MLSATPLQQTFRNAQTRFGRRATPEEKEELKNLKLKNLIPNGGNSYSWLEGFAGTRKDPNDLTIYIQEANSREDNDLRKASSKAVSKLDHSSKLSEELQEDIEDAVNKLFDLFPLKGEGFIFEKVLFIFQEPAPKSSVDQNVSFVQQLDEIRNKVAPAIQDRMNRLFARSNHYKERYRHCYTNELMEKIDLFTSGKDIIVQLYFTGTRPIELSQDYSHDSYSKNRGGGYSDPPHSKSLEPVAQSLEILGIKDPSVMQITQEYFDEKIQPAYRELIKQHHPDQNPNVRKAAEKRSRELIEAYKFLQEQIGK